MNSPVRFAGLTSGMDTQSMVQQLMRAESMRMDRLTRRRQTLQWRQETIRASMTRMNEFRSERTDFIRPGAINNSATWNTNETTVTNASGGSANGITVTAQSAGARQGSFDVQVRQVAQGDMALGRELTLDHEGTIDLNQELWTFVVSQDITADPMNVPVQDRHVLINGRVINFDYSTTVNQFMERVNNSEAGVKLRFDTMRNRFIMESTRTGANATVRTGNDDFGLLAAMGLEDIGAVPPPSGVIAGFPPMNDETLSGMNMWLLQREVPTNAGWISLAGLAIHVRPDDTINSFMVRVNRDLYEAGTTLQFGLQNGRMTLSGDYTHYDFSGIGNHALMNFFGLNTNRVNATVGNPPSPGPFIHTGNDLWVHMGGGSNVSSRMEPFGLTAGMEIQINRDLTVTVNANETFQGFMNRVNNTLAEVGPDSIVFDRAAGNMLFVSNQPPEHRLVRQAQNAIIYYDHGSALGAVRMEQAHNTFEIHGLNITLSAGVETARNVGGTYTGGVFTVNNERNIDAAIEAIQDFIEAYNTLLRYINAQHTTARPRAGGRATGAFFEPLTDLEREAMSDREIERWEEQARQGLLHRDSDMRSLHQQLRRAMFEPVNLGDRRSIAMHEIGITTIGRDGAPGDQMIGLLQIDEAGMARLRDALTNRPEDVEALFARTPTRASEIHDNEAYVNRVTIAQRNNRFGVVGLGFRLDDILNNFADDDQGPFQQRAGYHHGLNASENAITRQIRDYDRRLDRMQQWLNRRENHFFNMFARMEAAMAQSHAQMDALFAFAMQ